MNLLVQLLDPSYTYGLNLTFIKLTIRDRLTGSQSHLGEFYCYYLPPQSFLRPRFL